MNVHYNLINFWIIHKFREGCLSHTFDFIPFKVVGLKKNNLKGFFVENRKTNVSTLFIELVNIEVFYLSQFKNDKYLTVKNVKKRK